MAKTKKKRRAWTSGEVRELKTMARKKSKASQIAKKLRRTEGATRQKAFSIGLSLDFPFLNFPKHIICFQKLIGAGLHCEESGMPLGDLLPWEPRAQSVGASLMGLRSTERHHNIGMMSAARAIEAPRAA